MGLTPGNAALINGFQGCAAFKGWSCVGDVLKNSTFGQSWCSVY